MALARFLVRAFATDTMSLQKRMAQCFTLGQFDEALKVGIELKAVTRNEHGENHPAHLHVLGSLGQVYRALGQFDEAIQHVKEMHDKYLLQFGNLHKVSIHSKHMLGSAYASKGAYDVALTHFNEVLALRRIHAPREILDITETLLEIGKCYTGLRDCEKAMKALMEAKTIVGEKYGYDNILMGKVLEILAQAQSSFGEPSLAISTLQTAYAMHLEWYGPDHKTTQATRALIDQLLDSSSKI